MIVVFRLIQLVNLIGCDAPGRVLYALNINLRARYTLRVQVWKFSYRPANFAGTKLAEKPSSIFNTSTKIVWHRLAIASAGPSKCTFGYNDSLMARPERTARSWARSCNITAQALHKPGLTFYPVICHYPEKPAGNDLPGLDNDHLYNHFRHTVLAAVSYINSWRTTKLPPIIFQFFHENILCHYHFFAVQFVRLTKIKRAKWFTQLLPRVGFGKIQ